MPKDRNIQPSKLWITYIAQSEELSMVFYSVLYANHGPLRDGEEPLESTIEKRIGGNNSSWGRYT